MNKDAAIFIYVMHEVVDNIYAPWDVTSCCLQQSFFIFMGLKDRQDLSLSLSLTTAFLSP